MSTLIYNKEYAPPPFCKKEILRYAGCKEADEKTEELLNICLSEAEGKIRYKVVYGVFDLNIESDECDLSAFKVKSSGLAENLKECKKVLLFGATVGIELDRMISKYSKLSPSKALMIQAIGAERIEALCDAFCLDISKELNVDLRPRFSPGYGDLPLDVQKNIIELLECPKRIGLTLNDSLLMSPSKSVTAFAGIYERADGENSENGEKKEAQTKNKCSLCDNKDCIFRRSI